MSGGLRLSLGAPGATTRELLELARWADHWNLAALWLGDPRARAPNSADSYVTAAAGALAAVTEDVRLGLFLTLADERQVVRLAEDVAVADQASGGRLELGFVPPPAERRAWAGRVARLLRAPNAWPLPGRDETVAVVPGPAQPVVPSLIVGDTELAELLGAGRMVGAGSEPATAGSKLVAPRTVVLIELVLGRGGVVEWLDRPGAYERVGELRGLAAAVGAHELLLSLRSLPSEQDLTALGTVLVPSLRASDRDARAIATDSWTWLTAKRDLHEPPAAQENVNANVK